MVVGDRVPGGRFLEIHLPCGRVRIEETTGLHDAVTEGGRDRFLLVRVERPERHDVRDVGERRVVFHEREVLGVEEREQFRCDGARPGSRDDRVHGRARRRFGDRESGNRVEVVRRVVERRAVVHVQRAGGGDRAVQAQFAIRGQDDVGVHAGLDRRNRRCFEDELRATGDRCAGPDTEEIASADVDRAVIGTDDDRRAFRELDAAIGIDGDRRTVTGERVVVLVERAREDARAGHERAAGRDVERGVVVARADLAARIERDAVRAGRVIDQIVGPGRAVDGDVDRVQTPDETGDDELFVDVEARDPSRDTGDGRPRRIGDADPLDIDQAALDAHGLRALDETLNGDAITDHARVAQETRRVAVAIEIDRAADLCVQITVDDVADEDAHAICLMTDLRLGEATTDRREIDQTEVNEAVGTALGVVGTATGLGSATEAVADAVVGAAQQQFATAAEDLVVAGTEVHLVGVERDVAGVARGDGAAAERELCIARSDTQADLTVLAVQRTIAPHAGLDRDRVGFENRDVGELAGWRKVDDRDGVGGADDVALDADGLEVVVPPREGRFANIEQTRRSDPQTCTTPVGTRRRIRRLDDLERRTRSRVVEHDLRDATIEVDRAIAVDELTRGHLDGVARIDVVERDEARSTGTDDVQHAAEIRGYVRRTAADRQIDLFGTGDADVGDPARGGDGRVADAQVDGAAADAADELVIARTAEIGAAGRRTAHDEVVAFTQVDVAAVATADEDGAVIATTAPEVERRRDGLRQRDAFRCISADRTNARDVRKGLGHAERLDLDRAAVLREHVLDVAHVVVTRVAVAARRIAHVQNERAVCFLVCDVRRRTEAPELAEADADAGDRHARSEQRIRCRDAHLSRESGKGLVDLEQTEVDRDIDGGIHARREQHRRGVADLDVEATTDLDDAEVEIECDATLDLEVAFRVDEPANVDIKCAEEVELRREVQTEDVVLDADPRRELHVEGENVQVRAALTRTVGVTDLQIEERPGGNGNTEVFADHDVLRRRRIDLQEAVARDAERTDGEVDPRRDGQRKDGFSALSD